MCRASNTNRDLAWVDTRHNSDWRQTRFSHEDYLEWLRVNGLAIPILLALVIGLRLECTSIDSLHVMDLGLAAHVVANTLWETVLGKEWGQSTQDKNVAALEADMKNGGKRTRLRQGSRGSSLRNASAQKIRGLATPSCAQRGQRPESLQNIR